MAAYARMSQVAQTWSWRWSLRRPRSLRTARQSLRRSRSASQHRCRLRYKIGWQYQGPCAKGGEGTMAAVPACSAATTGLSTAHNEECADFRRLLAQLRAAVGLI